MSTVTWYHKGHKSSRPRLIFATLSSSLRRPLPFVLGLFFIALTSTLARLLVGSLDLAFAFILAGLLLAYAGLCTTTFALLRLLEIRS